jgi:hypothetical protein
LLGLRLPSQDTVRGDSFIELVGGLRLPKSDEENIVSGTLWYLDDALQTPSASLGSELRIAVEDIVDLFARIVFIENQLTHNVEASIAAWRSNWLVPWWLLLNYAIRNTMSGFTWQNARPVTATARRCGHREPQTSQD